jgi:hypothetical protein
MTLGHVFSNGNCAELPRTCDTGREGSSRRSTNINNNSSDKNSIDKNPIIKRNSNNKINRKTARKLVDIPPVTGMCLLLALVTMIVAFVAGANPFLIAALAAVVVALASKIP